MAVNQVSLFFYPPRWQQRLEPDPTALTGEDKSVHIVTAVPIAGSDATPVSMTAMTEWLVEQDFAPVEWGTTFHRGLVRSIFGEETEIEVCVNDEAGEVIALYCRFTLPGPNPPALAEWTAFVVSLCSRFSLRLGAEGAAPCCAAEFVTAVRNHSFYREFAEAFGWESDSQRDQELHR